MLPHVVGDLVTGRSGALQGLRVEFADAARREHGRFYAMAVEQLNQAPDSDPASELALGELHRWLVPEPTAEHRVEVESKVDRNPLSTGPGEIRDGAKPGLVPANASRKPFQFVSRSGFCCGKNLLRTHVCSYRPAESAAA